MPQTLAFDIYGTLINTSGVFTKLNQMIGDQAEAVMKSWRQKQLEYSFRRGLMRRHRDFSVCTSDALVYACKSYNIDLNPDQQNELLHQYRILPIYSDVKECLNSCRNQRHRLYAFSNGSKSAVRQLLEYNRLLSFFDGIVSTEEVKMFKPSPDVYQHFTDTTGSESFGTWLISGNPFDVMGARACGWNAAWVQRSDDSIFDSWDEFSPTAKVQSLNELPDILDKS